MRIRAIKSHHIVDVAAVQHVEQRHHAHFLNRAALKEGVRIGTWKDAIPIVSCLLEQLRRYGRELAAFLTQLTIKLSFDANDQTVIQNQDLFTHFTRKDGIYEEEKACQASNQLADIWFHFTLRQNDLNYEL